MKRLIRVYRRAGSMRQFIATVLEEIFVRAWSRGTIRNISSPFVSDYEPPKWVFLVGCFNSGTTILQKILNSHPDISGLPREGVRFTSVLSNLELHGHHMMWADDFPSHVLPDLSDSDAYIQIKKDWGVFWKKGSAVFLDKSVANTARIKWLSRVFPNAAFIGIHRNGYCVSEGLRRRAIPPGWLVKETGDRKYPLANVANQWVRSNEIMLDEFSGLNNSLLVSFEALVSNPVREVKSILQFIGVDAEAVSIDSESGELNIFGSGFVIRDPNPSSLERLAQGSKEIVASIIKPMMVRLGYTACD